MLFCCVLLFFVMFSRLSHSVLTSDTITFLNDPLMAFFVLKFSKIVCHELVTNDEMRGGGLKIAIFVATSFLNDPMLDSY